MEMANGKADRGRGAENRVNPHSPQLFLPIPSLEDDKELTGGYIQYLLLFT
jgi:hypothetical protein